MPSARLTRVRVLVTMTIACVLSCSATIPRVGAVMRTGQLWRDLTVELARDVLMGSVLNISSKMAVHRVDIYLVTCINKLGFTCDAIVALIQYFCSKLPACSWQEILFLPGLVPPPQVLPALLWEAVIFMQGLNFC